MSAVDEYRKHVAYAKSSHVYATPHTIIAHADDAIAELEGYVTQHESRIEELLIERKARQSAIAELEAENERLSIAALQDQGTEATLLQRAEKAEATIAAKQATIDSLVRERRTRRRLYREAIDRAEARATQVPPSPASSPPSLRLVK